MNTNNQNNKKKEEKLKEKLKLILICRVKSQTKKVIELRLKKNIKPR